MDFCFDSLGLIVPDLSINGKRNVIKFYSGREERSE